MKKIISTLLALFMLAAVPCAMAAGNATIAVQGQNDFEDYISSMFVWDGRLLMSSWNALYTWSPEHPELVQIEGYDELQSMMDESLTDRLEQMEKGGTVQLGETEIEVEEGEYFSLDSTLLPLGDKLYRMAGIYGENGVVSSLLIELLIAEDGGISLGEVIDLGDMLLEEYGDDYTGRRDLMTPCYAGGVLYALSYGDNGRELLALDLENETCDPLTLDTEAEITGLAPYTEGKLLMIATDYTQESPTTSLMVYDIESEELTDLGGLPVEGWRTPSGVAFDEARGKIYYTMGGSVYRADVSETGIGTPEEFGDMPLEVYSDAAAVVLGDLYIISSYEGVVGRDVTLDKLPEQKLKIVNNGYVDCIKKAYYPFTDKHPEYMVSISGSADTSSILQDMMNRSDAVDIYTMDMQDGSYGALFERGFMAELGASQTLCDAVAAMYPIMREAVTKDGELYALPVDSYSSCMTLNVKLLTEKFGFTEEELPQTWTEMFAMIAKLSDGRMEDVPEASLLNPGYIERDAKFNVFYNMLGDYFLWLDQSEENVKRSGEVLIALCEAFEQIDWSGFGLPEEYEDDQVWEYNPENIIMSNNGVGINYYIEESQTATPLAIEGEPKVGLNMTVAFVNPFSKHREAAIEYLETAYGLMDVAEKMGLCPEMNDPVENKYYKENLASFDKNIEDMKAALEKSEDEENRDMLTQSIEEMEQYREEYVESGRWDVSPEKIERYRKLAGSFAIATQSVWSSDSSEPIYQYLDGAITAQQLAASLEKTLQMKRLEGM